MGQFLNDKKNGYGIYYWQDGRVYEGFWYNGKQHGPGQYSVPSAGRKQFGIWENGKRIEWINEDEIEKVNS